MTEHSKEIIKAYGKYYDKVKKNINKDGWYRYFAMKYEKEEDNLNQFEGIKFDYDYYNKKMRPKSLSELSVTKNTADKIINQLKESKKTFGDYNKLSQKYLSSEINNTYLKNTNKLLKYKAKEVDASFLTRWYYKKKVKEYSFILDEIKKLEIE